MIDRELGDRLRAAASAALGRAVRVQRIGALGGASHRSFRLDTDLGSVAVKLREPGAAHVLELAEEHRVHARVAAAGLAPAPVGFEARAGALVTRYVAGAVPLTSGQAARPAMIRRLGELLRALHRVPATGVAAFTAEAHARRYVAAAGGGAGLDAADRALAAELIGLAAEFDERVAAPVLCHADLVASNVLDSGRLWLIDFEYAAAADRVLDLASLAAMNRFDARQRGLLLDAYYGTDARPWAAADFDRVVRLPALMAYFWAAAEAERGRARPELAEYRRRDPFLLDQDEP